MAAMTDELRAVSLLAATLTMGLVAGVFALYSHTIMPGLKHTDDRTFVSAFQCSTGRSSTRGSCSRRSPAHSS